MVWCLVTPFAAAALVVDASWATPYDVIKAVLQSSDNHTALCATVQSCYGQKCYTLNGSCSGAAAFCGLCLFFVLLRTAGRNIAPGLVIARGLHAMLQCVNCVFCAAEDCKLAPSGSTHGTSLTLLCLSAGTR